MKRMSAINLNAAAVAVALTLLMPAMTAQAADPVYPTGSRIGLVPPGDMVLSKSFPGFQDPAKDAAMIVTTLPAAAYAQIQIDVSDESLKKQGVTPEKRDPMEVSFGKGLLIVATQTADKVQYRKWVLVVPGSDFTALVSVQVAQPDDTYSDQVIRATLATVTARDAVPDQEQLTLLPFSIGDLSGFHVASVLAGRAVVLADIGDENNFSARLLIAALPGGPSEQDNRGDFARMAFDTIGGIKDTKITMSEPLRMNGQQGYQTMAQAKSVQGDTDIMVVQWLRFGTGGFIQMVGMGRAGDWANTLGRLRAVRDSVEGK
jgi:hypothetical protein